MRYPLIIMVGKAGSGKDTVASYVANKTGAYQVAQAAPLKQFAKDVLEATDEQLYGPSHLRNVPIGPLPVTTIVPPDERGNGEVVDLPPTATKWLNKWMQGFSTTLCDTRLFSWYMGVRKLQKTQEVTLRYVLQTLGTEFGRSIDPDIWSNVAIESCKKQLRNGSPLGIITDGRFRNEVLNVLANGGEAWLIEDPNAPPSAATHASEAEQDTIPRWWFTTIIKNDKTQGLDELHRKLDALMWAYRPQ